LAIGCGSLIIGLGLLFLSFFQFWDVGGDLVAAKKIEIKKGLGLNEIAGAFKNENLIRSEIIFKAYGLVTGQARQFKPGCYILETDVSVPKLTKILAKGPSEISVTIVPGTTLREIDETLSSLSIIEPHDLIGLNIDLLKKDYFWLNGAETLEGFLLPDTYNFFLCSESLSVAGKFLENFKLKALPIFKNSDNILETVNLASILEREIPDYEERRLAAGLLKKRLAVKMPLQVDATLLYNKCGGRFSGCSLLEKKDFDIDSPYNTYLRLGLPQGPICNQGIEAIKAAASPKQSDYWYYLSDPKTKKTIFSKTLDEHNKNRAIYLLKR